MAIIDFLNGSRKTVDATTGYQIWQIFNGEVVGTPAQQQYCSQIRDMNLNWRKAPDSYILRHADALRLIVRSYWMVNRQGQPTKPEPSDLDCQRVSRLLGLL